MEGLFFYWITWMTWVYSTFIMKKDSKRLLLSLFFLVIIIISPYSFFVGPIHVNFTVILVLFVSYMFIIKKTIGQLVYLLLCTLTITIAYVSFHLFELFDPIWLFVDRMWMLTFALVYLTLLLIKDSSTRVACILIGCSQGEMLYGIVLSKFRFNYEIGGFAFLDVVALSTIIVFLWMKLEDMVHYFDVFFQKHTKEKQG